MSGVPQRLLALVREYPGLHVRELARQLGTSVALVEYHLDALARQGQVKVRPDEVFHRVYPADAEDAPGARDRQALAVLRRKVPLQLVLHLLQAGPQRHTDLAAVAGVGKSTLSFHLKKMADAGLVARDAEGRVHVRDPSHVEGLLRRWKPTPDLRGAFEALWDDLYGKP